jgi:magnesium transporter
MRSMYRPHKDLDTLLISLSLLSRAHSNYLAQINIRMNERQEKTSDILGKLTVLGTIVLPMNVVTGIWGMNW